MLLIDDFIFPFFLSNLKKRLVIDLTNVITQKLAVENE